MSLPWETDYSLPGHPFPSPFLYHPSSSLCVLWNIFWRTKGFNLRWNKAMGLFKPCCFQGLCKWVKQPVWSALLNPREHKDTSISWTESISEVNMNREQPKIGVTEIGAVMMGFPQSKWSCKPVLTPAGNYLWVFLKAHLNSRSSRPIHKPVTGTRRTWSAAFPLSCNPSPPVGGWCKELQSPWKRGRRQIHSILCSLLQPAQPLQLG